MIKIKSLFLTTALAIIATASFGQTTPKTDRQERMNLASEKREHRKTLFLPNVEARHALPLRAAQASKSLLDSIVTQMNPALDTDSENTKTVYHYNAAGNLILEIDYRWNATTQAWEEYRRQGYDDRGNLILEIEQYTYEGWDEKVQDYVNYTVRNKYEYTYDNLNWQTLSAHYTWDFNTEQWVSANAYGGKYEYAYIDNAGSYTETTTQYDWHDGAWAISNREEITIKGQREKREPSSNDYDNAPAFNDFPTLPETQKIYPENLLARVYWGYNYDSNAWERTYKTEYTTNAAGNVTEERSFDWNATANTWNEQSRTRIDYAYNAQNQLTSVTAYSWDYNSNSWSSEPSKYSSYTVAYTFDDKSNVLSYTKTYLGDWYHDNSKVEYTYNVQNRAVTAIAYGYDYQTEQWVKQTAYERSFDTYGNVNLSVIKHWDGSVWRKEQTNEYAYDAEGRQIMHSYLYGNNGSKNEYAFDTNGNRILSIYYDYDPNSQAFVPYHKSEYTYGNELVNWDGENYNPLTIKQSSWDVQTNTWIVEMEGKYEWTFDSDNNPQILNLSVKVENQWIWYGTMTWYYSQHEVGIRTITNDQLRITVSGNELEIENYERNIQIFDISGKMMINEKLLNGKLEIGHLPKGVFIVKAGGRTAKFVK